MDAHQAVTGINSENVTAWMLEHEPTAVAPFSFELIAGGHSNMTFRMTDENGKSWALRRPPLKQVLATAHDMLREYKIISALADSDVPVPKAVGLCEDTDINERPFYVMEFMPGTILRTTEIAETFPVEIRAKMARTLVTVMARIHAVDVDAVGLGDLGKKEDYIARQLRRWMRQYDESKVEDRVEMREIHDHLAARIPDQGTAGIVHGDYRLDNCMMSDSGEVAAVLDWELCTLGDVRADVSQLLGYWARPGDQQGGALRESPTLADGFPEKDEVLELYEAESGRSMANIDYYLCFSAWRLASIIEGVYSRYVGGAMGDKDPGAVEEFVVQRDDLIARALHHAALIS